MQTPGNLPLRREPAQVSLNPVQGGAAQGKPVKKYNLSYGQNGEIFYNGANVGNYYTSNIFEIGEERYVENWAKQNSVDLQPSIEWVQQNRTPLRKEDRESDVAEQNVMKTFNVSDQARNTEKPGAQVDIASMGNMQPLTQNTATQTMDKPITQNVDNQQYGKGFAPETLNPFFRK